MPIRLPYDNKEQSAETQPTPELEEKEPEITPTKMGRNSSVTSMKKQQSIKKLQRDGNAIKQVDEVKQLFVENGALKKNI